MLPHVRRTSRRSQTKALQRHCGFPHGHPLNPPSTPKGLTAGKRSIWGFARTPSFVRLTLSKYTFAASTAASGGCRAMHTATPCPVFLIERSDTRARVKLNYAGLCAVCGMPCAPATHVIIRTPARLARRDFDFDEWVNFCSYA